MNTAQQGAQASERVIAAVLAAPDASIETSGINGGGRVTAVISARSHQAVITTACLPALAGSPGAGFRAGHGGVSASPHITA